MHLIWVTNRESQIEKKEKTKFEFLAYIMSMRYKHMDFLLIYKIIRQHLILSRSLQEIFL